jgi:sugar (pentulose or hexulose) kinase
MAAIGAGLGGVAPVSDSTGTVIACVRSADDYNPKKNCCMGPGVGAGYYQLGWDNNGAGVLDWYQKTQAPDASFPKLDAEAKAIPPGADGLTALPQADRKEGLAGFLDYRDNHTRGHYVRAILESVSASLTHLIDYLCPESRPQRIVSTGGGAKSDVWLQIKADMLGVEFAASDCPEPACLGAAMVSAVALGWFDDIQSAGITWASTRRIFRPRVKQREFYRRWYEDYQKHLE